VLPSGPLLQCYEAQRLSAGLRDAEAQDREQSASVSCLPHPSLPPSPSHGRSVIPMPYIWSPLFLGCSGWSRESTPGRRGTARGKAWLCLCGSEGRHVKRRGLHTYSADACRRNEGDDVCSAQAEIIDNCQTTISLLSTRELDFFSEAPDIAKFVPIFFQGS